MWEDEEPLFGMKNSFLVIVFASKFIMLNKTTLIFISMTFVSGVWNFDIISTPLIKDINTKSIFLFLLKESMFLNDELDDIVGTKLLCRLTR